MRSSYEEYELEGEDLYCEVCGRLIGTNEYIEGDGICFQCHDENANGSDY